MTMYDLLDKLAGLLTRQRPQYKPGDIVSYIAKVHVAAVLAVVTGCRFTRQNGEGKREWMYQITCLSIGLDGAIGVSTYTQNTGLHLKLIS